MCVFVCLYAYIQNNKNNILSLRVLYPKTHFLLLQQQQQQQQQQQFLYLYFGKGTKRNEKEDTNGYGHTKRKAPLLARSVKLSLFGLG